MRPIVAYEVRVNTQDGKNRLLVGGLPATEQALFIEQTLERYLHIEDAPVKGELDA